jgi:micrococcal nuclease
MERRDHYARWLAHVYLPDRGSVTADLLRMGLATQLTVPPNTYDFDCYRRAEAKVRAERAGIWHLPTYQVLVH